MNSFANKIVILPNGNKVYVKDFLYAIKECLLDEKYIEYNIKKTSKKAKQALVVAGLVSAVTSSILSNTKESNKNIIGIEKEENINFDAGVSYHMNNSLPILDAGVSLDMKKIPSNIDVSDNDEKTYENIFLGYDLKDVPYEEKDKVLEYQKILYDNCRKYGIPFNVMMTILDNESGGRFNTNGVINNNTNNTSDYGLFQINSCNFKYIENDLGITPNELLNDPAKNIEAACYHFRKEILDRYQDDIKQDIKNNDWSRIFTTYNKGHLAEGSYGTKAQEKMNTIYNKTIDELSTIIYYDKDDEHVKSR